MAFIPYYILILFYLIAIDFVAGLAIERSDGRRRGLFLIISIVANIGTLVFFKYFNFFNANVAGVASLLHWNYSPWLLAIALPLGLSFHTFQSLAYVIEVYKGRYPAEKNLGIYALYVMFFPQLVAGPIERPQQLLPQLHEPHDFSEENAVQGLRIMLWGFFKKVVVADTIGVLVDTVYGNLHGVSGVMLCIAAVAFAIQLYADFSGYSDIARGSAKVLGITLVNNFDTPYFTKSIADFWRRWHISLSSWFRDYLYQPLALVWSRRASRNGLYAALFFTFVVIGLWHGAGWNFIVFGALFGAYSVVGLMTKKIRTRIAEKIGLVRLPRLYSFLQMITTFALVAIGLVFFRAPSLTDAWYVISHLWTGWGSTFSKEFWVTKIFDQVATGLPNSRLFFLPVSCAIMLFGEYFERTKNILARLAARPLWFRWGAYYALIVVMLVFGYYQQRTFIYFQF